MENRFDELAKDLARGLSRREALCRLGGSLAGTVLASLGLGRAWGDPGGNQGGNSDCAQFCDQVFPPGDLRGACTSDAAMGLGLCPACNADVTRVCGTSLTSLTCCLNTPISTCCSSQCTDLTTSPQNCGTCGNVCPATTPFCMGGTCVQCRTDSDCAAGQACQNGVCVNQCYTCGPSSPFGICLQQAGAICNCNPACECTKTTEGTIQCVFQGFVGTPCTGSSQCPAGQVCVDLMNGPQGTCEASMHCFQLCPT